MYSGEDFTSDQRDFIGQALGKTMQCGDDAALLLVGSRAARLNDSWSDLDLWILGNRDSLTPDEQRKYEADGQLFCDRGDGEAHWSFFDYGDIERARMNWDDEILWILGASQFISGHPARIQSIKNSCMPYPSEVAERKLKWQFGKYCTALGPLSMAARGKPLASFVAAGQVTQCLCKMCCLAERKPYPYMKWLTEAAKETRLGSIVLPFVQRAMEGIDEFSSPPPGKPYRELVPLRELRATLETVQQGLKDLGWSCSWIDHKDEALSVVCSIR